MKCKINKKVRGIGSNDAPEGYVIVKYEYVEGKRIKVWECPIYSHWTNMLTRCTSEKGKYSYDYSQEHNGVYVGVTCNEDWLSFWKFREWCITQDYKGNHLDKDLLGDGTHYGPETCCFIPASINCSINRGRGGNLPFGVGYGNNKTLPYTSQVVVENEVLYKMKSFSTVDEAHNYWKEGKILALQILADKYFNLGKIDNRVYGGLQGKISKLKISLRDNTLLYKL